MRVTHDNDLVTHAVIGGKKTIDFGISNNAEFFHILSSSLYTNQILAVVREVLCNAWDAHIAAGKTDTPVIVTLTDDKIEVTDQGKGISDDDIGPIYGVYGSSTKKNDGTQTGGFGLGCKAPFAYTEHFQVTSSHGGTKTIYSMSKSSGEVQGKPGITPIVSFPCAETGLSVSINIKNSNDALKFKQYVREVARNGEMNVELNEKKIDGIGLNNSPHNFIIVSSDIADLTQINLRYGNVIYPIPKHESYGEYFDKIEKLINSLTRRSYPAYKLCFVIQAPPHTIAVTPSRESLSLQEHTIKNISKLLKDFCDNHERKYDRDLYPILETKLNRIIASGNGKELIRSNYGLPKTDNEIDGKKICVRTKEDIAVLYLGNNYPDRNYRFCNKDVTLRVEKLAKEGMLDKHLAKTFLKHNGNRDQWQADDWFNKHITAKLMNKLDKHGLTINNVYVMDEHYRFYRDNSHGLCPILNYATKSINSQWVFCQNRIILSHSKINLITRLGSLESTKNKNLERNCLVYLVPRSKDQIAKVREFFKRMRMTVYDVLDKEPWEIQEKQIKDANTANLVKDKPKKRTVGLVTLTEVVKRANKGYSFAFESEVRLKEPKLIVCMKPDHNLETIYNMGRDETKLLLPLIGDLTGVAKTQSQYDLYLSKGAISLKTFLNHWAATVARNNKKMKAYHASNPDRLDRGYYNHHAVSFLELMRGIAEFREEYKMRTLDDPIDKMVYHNWIMARSVSYCDPLEEVRKEFEKVPLSRHMVKLFDNIKENKIVETVNGHGLSVRHDMSHDPKQKAKIVRLIKLVLED